MNQVPHSKRTFWELLMRSVMENDRLSPRLLTTFLFTAAALGLLWRGAVYGTWPPDYIWSGLLLVIAGLLGLGKVTEGLVTRTKIQAEAQVAIAETTGLPPAAPASATTTTTTTLDPVQP